MHCTVSSCQHQLFKGVNLSGCLLMKSSVKGVQGQENTICALKGSSVDLFCSAKDPLYRMNWYTVHMNVSNYFMTKLSTNQTRVMLNESDFTLRIKDLRETDFKTYCCRENTDQPELCWKHRTELHVAGTVALKKQLKE